MNQSGASLPQLERYEMKQNHSKYVTDAARANMPVWNPCFSGGVCVPVLGCHGKSVVYCVTSRKGFGTATVVCFGWETMAITGKM